MIIPSIRPSIHPSIHPSQGQELLKPDILTWLAIAPWTAHTPMHTWGALRSQKRPNVHVYGLGGGREVRWKWLKEKSWTQPKKPPLRGNMAAHGAALCTITLHPARTVSAQASSSGESLLPSDGDLVCLSKDGLLQTTHMSAAVSTVG